MSSCHTLCDELGVRERVDQLLTLLNIPYDHASLVEDTCNVVPVLCEMVLPNSTYSCDVSLVLELLHLLPVICSAKELCIILLEQMKTLQDDQLFFALLPPLSKSIQKLPSKKHLSLELVLESLSAHVRSLSTTDEPSDCVVSLPSGFGRDEERLAKTIDALLDFIAPFVDELVQMPVSKRAQPAAVHQTANICHCVLQILGDSLASVNLCDSIQESDVTVQSPCRECAERCISLIVRLHPDIVKLIADNSNLQETIEQQQSNSANHRHASGDLVVDETEELSNTEQPLPASGLAVLLYLVRSEKLCVDSIPQVYRHRHLLELNLHLVYTLMTVPNSTVIHKGIMLASSLFTDVGVNSLESSVLEHNEMLNVVQAIVTAMTSARVKEVSQSAVQLLRVILKAFDIAGRCRLLDYLIVSCSNKNVQGYAISLLKDEIDECLSSGESLSSYCVGMPLKQLILKVFEPVLPGYSLDLLTSLSDRVMATLNLLRYLVIRDKREENLTGIWDLLPGIDESYLRPLRAGIVLCRKDVNAEIYRLEHSSNEKQANPDDALVEAEFSVNDQLLPNLTSDERMKAMHTALISLDMMESVLSRVDQLVNFRQ